MRRASRSRLARACAALLIFGSIVVPAATLPGDSLFQQSPAGVVVRVHYDDPSEIRQLATYDLWEFNDKEQRYVLVAVNATQFAELVDRGFALEVDDELTWRLNQTAEPLPMQISGIPGFPCYRTVEETLLTAAEIALTYPNLAAWSDVGDSWEKVALGGGYDIHALRLTNESFGFRKPVLVITAAIHAREYATAELVLRFAEELVSGYGVDADATWILDYHEIHLLFQTNPDGRKQAEAGQLWRKNTNQEFCGPTNSNRGIDLNRNFEFEWGCCGGSSGGECDSTFRGPAPASEPETQAVQNYLRSVLPDQRDEPLSSPAPDDTRGVYIDVHSYSQLVLWPWGFDGEAPNGTALTTLGRKLALFNGYTPQQAIELYPTDGTTIDFAYGDLGVPAFVYELGTWFFQDCDEFEEQLIPGNLPSLRYAAKVVGAPYLLPAGPDASDITTSATLVLPGEDFEVTATADDTRYNNANGTEPSQTIAAAELYVDIPAWAPGATPVSLVADDGTFDESVEVIRGVVDTANLGPGRHTLFLRAQDADGNWGATSAVFFEVTAGALGTVVGMISDADSGEPLAGAVHADALGLSVQTEPLDGSYLIDLPEGEWTLRASAINYQDAVIPGVTVVPESVAIQDFTLAPADDDGDGIGNSTDCAPSDPFVWSVPSPAFDLQIDKGLSQTISWSAPLEPGSSYLRYDLLRSTTAGDFDSALCLQTISGTSTSDPTEPGVGQVYHYLIRAWNRCGGNLGLDSSGTPRSGTDCSLN